MKILTEEEWDSISIILEVVQLKALNDREWLDLSMAHQHIFTPEFLGLRYNQKQIEVEKIISEVQEGSVGCVDATKLILEIFEKDKK